MSANLPSWVRFGVQTDGAAATGVSLFAFAGRAPAAVSIRGYGSATRHVDRLLQFRARPLVDAICLCGGSAFGLGAADGVMAVLERSNNGEPIRDRVVPIVPSAAIFDLFVGDGQRRPGPADGAAAAAALGEAVTDGATGAGTGAAVGKLLGVERATKLGAGWAAEGEGADWRGVYAVVNAFGDVVDPADGRVLAGIRGERPGEFVPTAAALAGGAALPTGGNTTLAVALIEGDWGAADLHYMADYLQGALRLCIRPCHTPADGDVVFVAASGRGPTTHPMAAAVALESTMLAAVARAVAAAPSAYGLPGPEEWRHVA